MCEKHCKSEVRRNRTLFHCNHAHIWHMPFAYAPFKLVIVNDSERDMPRFLSFSEQYGLLEGIDTLGTKGCDCLRAWAKVKRGQTLQRVGT